MAELEVYSGEEIRLVEQVVCGNDDYDSAIQMSLNSTDAKSAEAGDPRTKGKNRETEKESGFSGTALHGSYQSAQSPSNGQVSGAEDAAKPDSMQVDDDDA